MERVVGIMSVLVVWEVSVQGLREVFAIMAGMVSPAMMSAGVTGVTQAGVEVLVE